MSMEKAPEIWIMKKFISYNPDIFIVLPGQYSDEMAEKLGDYNIPVFVLNCASGHDSGRIQ